MKLARPFGEVSHDGLSESLSAVAPVVGVVAEDSVDFLGMVEAVDETAPLPRWKAKVCRELPLTARVER